MLVFGGQGAAVVADADSLKLEFRLACLDVTS